MQAGTQLICSWNQVRRVVRPSIKLGYVPSKNYTYQEVGRKTSLHFDYNHNGRIWTPVARRNRPFERGCQRPIPSKARRVDHSGIAA